MHSWTLGEKLTITKPFGTHMSCTLTFMTQVRLLLALKLVHGGRQALCAITGHDKLRGLNIPDPEASGRRSLKCSNSICSPTTQSEALL